MIILTLNEIVSIHSKLINKTGGLDGVRDIGLVESAVASVNNSFDNVKQYPTIEEKAARFAFSIVSNHAFIDGNKRIGVFVMLMTLKLNKIEIVFSQVELITLGLSIADGTFKYDEILYWIKEHKK